MTGNADPSLDEALAWAARVQDPAFEDWDAHADWLSGHPDNPARYHVAVLALEDGLAAILAAERERPAVATMPTPSNDDEPPSAPRSTGMWRWRAGAGMGIAACIAGLVFMPHAAREQEILLRGRPGHATSSHLPDGSLVVLNGDSVLRFRGGARRIAMLDRGEAFVQVAHDPGHVFELHAGDRVFRDVGTAFDVSRLGDTVTLAVAEGAVAFDPEGANIAIAAGRAISIHGSAATMSDTPTTSVAAWRAGRLVFRDAMLADVARDLTLSLGRPVRLDAGLGARRFTGVVVLTADRDETVDQVARMAGLRTSRADDGWLLAADKGHASTSDQERIPPRR